jgi:hypothetical protein
LLEYTKQIIRGGYCGIEENHSSFARALRGPLNHCHNKFTTNLIHSRAQNSNANGAPSVFEGTQNESERRTTNTLRKSHRIRNIPDVRNSYILENLNWDSYLSRNFLTSTRTKPRNNEYVSVHYVMQMPRQNIFEKARTYHKDRSLWTFMLRMLNSFTSRK